LDEPAAGAERLPRAQIQTEAIEPALAVQTQPASAAVHFLAGANFTCRVPRQHYSLGAIAWFVELVLSAPCSQRAAATVLSWISLLGSGCQKTPCANAGRTWLFRLGLYELTCPKPAGDDWVWLVDHTVQLGSHKGLVVIGLRLGAWQAQPRPLEHQDVRLLHLEPMEHSNGQAVRQELEKVIAQTGIPRQIVSDSGPDLKKGIELFRQDHPTIAYVYDITHKVALMLKKELEVDSTWEQFISESNVARRGLTLTSAGFLVPPALKTKARDMNVDRLVAWGEKVLTYLDGLPSLPVDPALEDPVNARRVEARLGWLRGYRRRLKQWSALVALGQAAEHYVRHQGWHVNSVEELRSCLKPLARCAATRRLQNKLLEFAAQQAAAAQPGERLIGSTEVLESLIGKYKRLQSMHSGNGMTRTILALGAIVGRRCVQTLRQALQHITNRDVTDWCHSHLGITLQALRQHAFTQEQIPPPLLACSRANF
jgi:hypothetical protein